MPRKFNPLDPLGLFKESDGPPRETSVKRGPGTLWPPPDPLGLFKQSEQEGGRRFLPAPPDPLGIFHRRAYRSTGNSGSPGGPPGATIGNPIPIEWADQVVPVKTQVREQLIGKGYRPQQVDMALHWAEEWLMGMARRMAPGNTELQKTVVVSGYADIASRAERWLQGIEAAFAIGGVAR